MSARRFGGCSWTLLVLLVVAPVSTAYAQAYTVTTTPASMSTIQSDPGTVTLFSFAVDGFVDNAAATVSLPFSFDFFGTSYNSIDVSTNGYATFGANGSDSSNDAIPDPATPNDYIALFWDDLDIATNGTNDEIMWTTQGTAPNRVVIIEYRSVSTHLSSSNWMYGQIRLYEVTNVIELHYDTGGNQNWSDPVSCTIGIENSTGAIGFGGPNTLDTNSTEPTDNYIFTPSGSFCGNGILEAGEDCDAGGESATCDADCTFVACGDGTTNTTAGEVCDDGNTVGGDGCAASCLSDETCGNGIADTAIGEVCDDGNTVDGDGCAANCLSDEACGNGITDAAAGEVCDDGNTVDGDGCSADCLSDETCGNGLIDTGAGEACDDGNTAVGDGCDATCQVDPDWTCVGEPSVCTMTGAVCGDGFIEGGEGCDDGGTAAGDGCSGSCQVEPGWSCVGEPSVCTMGGAVCGDGVLDAGESCDDGNNISGDGCGAACQVESTFRRGCGCKVGRTGNGSPVVPLLLLAGFLALVLRRRK